MGTSEKKHWGALVADLQHHFSVSDEIADAVLAWLVKRGALDAGNEYRAPDVIAALDGLFDDDAREMAWLIERNDLDRPHWFIDEIFPGRHGWTHEASEANRFATKAEAEAFPAYQMIASDPAISLTEHVFLGRAKRRAR